MERLEPGRGSVVFHSASGPLTVNRMDTKYVLDFPVRLSEPVSISPGLADALGVAPVEVFLDAFNYLVLLESAQIVRTLTPDLAAIARMDRGGVIVTAPGEGATISSAVISPGQRHPGRSCDRGRALHADALLGPATRQDYVSCLSGLTTRRRDHLPDGRRTRRAGRHLCVLPGR